ncbi:MAG: hypothetical protein BJ554DRAFT_6322, partial [Olpidium bornovanus]
AGFSIVAVGLKEPVAAETHPSLSTTSAADGEPEAPADSRAVTTASAIRAHEGIGLACHVPQEALCRRVRRRLEWRKAIAEDGGTGADHERAWGLYVEVFAEGPKERFEAALRAMDANRRVALTSLAEVALLARLLSMLPTHPGATGRNRSNELGPSRGCGRRCRSGTFTEATLAQLRIGGDGLLSDSEVALFQAFAFDDNEIGSVDPRIVPPMVIFTTAHVPWKLKPLPIPRAHYDKLLELLQA